MDNLNVNIRQGQLRGKIGEDIRGGKFYLFQGIPYAKPPVDNLRFKAPEPAEPWDGTLDCTKQVKISVQYDDINKKIVGSEDCLYLNVYTPHLPKSNRISILKPVMVFIHGGAFVRGSSKTDLYGPDFLISEDIVLVTINYRLGFFGFLSLGDTSLDIPGNAAFKDMVLALKWVKENIASFCGDCNNVTVFGESAGAASVHLLMLSPTTKGLFHKAIMQSGCVLNGWLYGKPNIKNLCKELGYESDNEKELLKFLLKASAESILRAQLIIASRDDISNKGRYVGLTIEDASSESAFLTENPVKILADGNYNKIPVIMGYNEDEGFVIESLVDRNKHPIYWTEPEINVPLFLNLSDGSGESKFVGEKITRYYFPEGNYSEMERKFQLYKIVTDNCFLRGIFSSVKIHAKTSKENVFFYRMNLDTGLNTYKKFRGIPHPGMSHADDLGYLFKGLLTPNIEPNSLEDISQRRLARLWTNFAKYSHPTPVHDPLLNVHWESATSQTVFFLDITEQLSLQKDPEPERMKFWDKIYGSNPETKNVL